MRVLPLLPEPYAEALAPRDAKPDPEAPEDDARDPGASLPDALEAGDDDLDTARTAPLRLDRLHL